MNPYESPSSSRPVQQVVAFRTARTLVDAAMLGLAVAAICPVYLALLWHLRSSGSILDNAVYLAQDYFAPSLPIIALALILGALVPPKLSSRLSVGRHSIPFAVLTLLFSAMFTLLGYGYLGGSLMIGGNSFSLLTIFNSTVVGIAVFLHLACRPPRSG